MLLLEATSVLYDQVHVILLDDVGMLLQAKALLLGSLDHILPLCVFGKEQNLVSKPNPSCVERRNRAEPRGSLINRQLASR